MTHGYSGYRTGCRCEVCRDGRRTYMADWRAGVRRRKERQHGTLRMYQTGCRCEPCKETKRAQARSWRARVRQVGLEPGDRRHGSLTGYRDYGCKCTHCSRVQRIHNAFRNDPMKLTPGYRPPADDLDEIAVERCIEGSWPYARLTKAEQREVIRLTHRSSATDLAAQFGISDRTVERMRAALRASADAA